MRKRSFLYWCAHGLLLLIPYIAFCDVYLAPGDSVSGTWSPSNGVYYCEGDVYVPSDSTLTINPGVYVVFETAGTFLVYGKLIAEGNPADSIHFKGPDDPVWLGIWFENDSSPECLLNYVSIENSFYGVRARHTSATVRNTKIVSRSVGIDVDYGFIAIEGCDIFVDDGQVDGIQLYDSDADINNCFITVVNDKTNNTCNGINSEYSDPDIFSCIINVVSQTQARGIYLHYGDKSRLQYNLITVTSDDQAYGMYLNDCTYPDIINQTIVIASPLDTDQGIHLLNNSNPRIVNTIIYGDENSVGVKAENGSNPDITYSDVYNNRINLINCTFGIGCISQDPLFDPTSSIYELSANSPCIDAGDPESPEDPDQTRADMGYMYYHQWPPAVENPSLVLPGSMNLLESYPNPFNSESRVRLVLPNRQTGQLVVYDNNGRLIAILAKGAFTPGNHDYTWSANHRSSGIYWVVFKTDRTRLVQKLVLLK